MYHERQRLQYCALHVLNNLFQAPIFTKQELDDICFSLNPRATVNPHKSLFGLGNYDVNVLTMAFKLKDYQFLWFDKRKDLSSLNLVNIFGIVINKYNDLEFLGFKIPVKRRHWVALRKVDGIYYNLDSKLNVPESIGNEESLRTFLSFQLSIPTTELFLVVSNSLPENSWWKGDG